MGKSKDSSDNGSANQPATERATWNKAWDFIFSCAGMTVGLGNVWRFPYLCYQNGGGAFLLPYLLSAAFLAWPMIYLEISFGQLMRKGILKSWSAIPLFKGIAFCNMMIMIYGNIHYTVIFTWISKYIVKSFSPVLPWTSCNHTWNTENCVDSKTLQNNNFTQFQDNFTQFNLTFEPNIEMSGAGMNLNGSIDTVKRLVPASEEFLKISVWGLSDGIETVGSIRTDLALYLGLIWLLTFLAIFRGLGWSAKIVYFTATVPVLLILVVLVRGVTLDGASTGIKYYLYPNMTKLQDAEVWVKACTQVFYSNALATGALLSMGSFNKYRYNFQRDSIIIVICNALTSFLSGFAVFSVLGFMAKQQNTTVDSVVQSGPGLVFVTYPEALSLLPLPNLWCALFFIMLLLLGFDSIYVYVESMQTFFLDIFPQVQKKKYGKVCFSAFVCVLFWILGLPLVTEGGVYIFEIFNQYGSVGWSVFFTSCCQFIAIGWCYGTERIFNDIYKMIGYTRAKPFIVLVWKYIGPLVTLAVTLYYFTAISPLSYEGYVYPAWAQGVANLVSIAAIIMLPGYAVYASVKHRLNCRKLTGRDKLEAEEADHDNPYVIPLAITYRDEIGI